MTAKSSTDEKTTVTEPVEAGTAVEASAADKPAAKPAKAAKAAKAEKPAADKKPAKADKPAADKADKPAKAAADKAEKAEKPAKAAADKDEKPAADAKAKAEKSADKADDKATKADKAEKAETGDKAEKADAKAEKSEKADKPAKAAKAEKLDKNSIAIKNGLGESVGTAKLQVSIFAIAPNIHVLHEVCRAQMAARRSGTHDTKTRGQVSGGGKKPFRQKGTGRARQGTIRAPHYKGGGAVFGPHPRNYAFKVNGKEVKLAMRSALSAKQAEGVLHIVNNLDFETPSTKEAIRVLERLEISGRVTLVLTDQDINAFLSFRNIPQVRVLDVADANTYDFIDNKALVLTQDALKRIEEVLQ